MSRAFNLTLGSLATASAIAFAQSPIEPPRRAVPPAAPATPAAPASSKGAVVLPGGTPPATPSLGSAPAAPAASPAAPTTTTATTPAPAAGSEVKPSIATGLSPAQNEALQKSRMRGSGRGFGPAGAGGPGGAGPAGAGAPATGSPLSTLIPGTPTSATPNPLTGNPVGAGTTNPAARGAGGNPADPFAAPPAGNPASSSANQIVELNDNLQATVDDVIADYEKNTGVTVLRANNLQGVVPISFNPAVKPTKAEYIDYLKAALMVNGFSIHEYSPTLHAITFTGQATPLFSAVAPRDGHKVYTRLVDLPERDEFVNFFMKFDYVTPQDAVTILGQPQHQSGKITPIPNAGGILITESVPVIKTFLAIKKEIDVPSGELINKFVQLKLADAEEVAGIIQQILQQQNSASKSGQGGGGTRVIGAPNAAVQLNNQLNAAPGSPGAVQQSAPDATSVAVQADRRTNRILLSGKKNDIAYIEKLIHDFDLPSEVNNLVTYQLRYIRVGDFLDLASQALEARGFGTSGGGGGSSSAGGANSRQSGGNGFPADPRSATQGGSSSGNRLSQSATSTGSSRSGSSRSSGGSAGGVSGGGGGGRGSVGNSSSAQALPTSTTVGKTLLISDPQSNSIIVSGPPESRDQIRLLIEQMDKRPLQVFIDCVIAEVNLSDKWEFGLDLLRKVDNVTIGGKSVDVAGLFRNTSSGGGIIDPATLTNIAAFPTAATGLNGYFQVGELVNAYVKAAESGSRIKVVQKPSFATANNEPGHISIGQQVPYPGSQQSTVTNGTNQSLNSTVEYKDVLLSLDVTPLINSKNEVTLQIEQINDNISGERTINNDSIPVIGQQDLTTKLTVPNGGIAFIGGLITDSRSNSNSGAPFLARIPVLKYLLGASKKDDSRRELMIFIQPRIMETADEMIDVNSKEIQRTQIGPEAIKFARPPYNTRDVILPQSNGTIPFDQAGHPTTPGEKPGFWRRLGGIFKQKNNVPADPAMPVQVR